MLDQDVDGADEVVEESPNDVLTGGDLEKKEVEQPEGAPEQYAFEFPEGFEANEADLEKFTTIFKEANLSQTNANKLLNAYAELRTVEQTQDVQEFDKLQKEWVKEARTDAEVGGQDFNQKLAVANKAMKQFATPELVDLFKFTGVGNNVEMVRFLYRVGKALSEDDVHRGTAQPAARDVAKLLFPSMQD